MALYVWRKNEARSYNNCWWGKGVNIIHFDCVFNLNYPACNALALYYIIIRGLLHSTISFPHYLINGTIFERKKNSEHKMCVLIFSTNFV